MMTEPPLTEIMKKFDSRYTLVMCAAIRARLLKDGAPYLASANSSKTVSMAVQEIYENKITYERKNEKN